ISWFTHSACPSVCRWYVVEGVSQMSRSVASSLEKLDTKVLPLLLMMASGSLWCLQTCLRKRCATPAESIMVMVATVWMCLDSLSTTTRIVLYPLDSSSSPLVLTEMTSQWQLGTWFGVTFPTFCIRKDNSSGRPALASSITLGGWLPWSCGEHGQYHDGVGGPLECTCVPWSIHIEATDISTEL